MSRKPLPYQLFRGDHYNIAPGVFLVFLLAAFKDFHRLPEVIRWQVNAYTNWNLSLIFMRVLLHQPQWDPFLCVNSLGVLVGFRTAFSQGLDLNLRKKIKSHGMTLSVWEFKLLDHLIHTLPATAFVCRLVRKKQRVPPISSLYCLVLSTWFAFRQQAQLNSSSTYVPHPWRRCWFGIVLSTMVTPHLVNAMVDKHLKKASALFALLFVPWLTTRFDPQLKKKYMFEYAVATVAAKTEPVKTSPVLKPHAVRGRPGMPRIQSEMLI
mmetsp:Transcript_13130/g.30682  ORF Transcript_13130/g.30682 Transcript_13130/m.30682 type:complete len:266 (-) Transcript_13130:121-918(-)|eukprot:CAMPEP_0178438752 /NCGR_PEP_ID=MMETSP0689_2-20121128/35769_1 /TAXON_ID=160604 /ORGANISM="Amphidinium massartii, Strain CS-259" /LENGTH=265 /DNA_ID=CAMNT_0020061193 /DNA_START=67 /DNA_END=864 /DNA_ORIENTATION=+